MMCTLKNKPLQKKVDVWMRNGLFICLLCALFLPVKINLSSKNIFLEKQLVFADSRIFDNEEECIQYDRQLGGPGRCLPAGESGYMSWEETRRNSNNFEANTNTNEVSFWDIITTPELLFAWIAMIIQSLLATLLSIAGAFLLFSIKLNTITPTILQTSGVTNAWIIVRDVITMPLLYYLSWTALGLILRTTWANARQIIPKIIITVLLVNFSPLIILLGVHVNQRAVTSLVGIIEDIGNATPAEQQGSIPANGISRAFLRAIGISSLVYGEKTDIISHAKDDREILFEIFVRFVMGSVFLILATLIIGAMAILFLGCPILFTFAYIGGAFMFIGPIFPGLKQSAEKLKDMFIQQLIFGPALLVMIVITLSILIEPNFRNAFSSVPVDSNGAFVANTVGGGLSEMALFAVALGLLALCIPAAKQLTSQTAGFTNFALKRAGKASFGVAGWAGRQTLGRASGQLANSGILNRMAANGNFIAKGLVRAGKKGEKASFDLRGAGMLDSSVGQAYSGGIKKMKEDAQKREKEYIENSGNNNLFDRTGAYAGKKIAESKLGKAIGDRFDQMRNSKTGQRLGDIKDKFEQMKGALIKTEIGRVLLGEDFEARRKVAQAARELTPEEIQKAKEHEILENAHEKATEEKKKVDIEVEKELETINEAYRSNGGQISPELTERREAAEKKRAASEEKLKKASDDLADSLENLNVTQRTYTRSVKELKDIQTKMKSHAEATASRVAQQNIDSFGSKRAAADAYRKEKGKSDEERMLETFRAWAEEKKKGEGEESSEPKPSEQS